MMFRPSKAARTFWTNLPRGLPALWPCRWTAIFKAAYSVPAANTVDVAEAFVHDDFLTNLLNSFAVVKAKMSEAAIPEDGRFAVISAHTQLALDEHFSTRGGTSVFVPATQEQTIRNGFTGRLMGYDLRLSRTPL